MSVNQVKHVIDNGKGIYIRALYKYISKDIDICRYSFRHIFMLSSYELIPATYRK